MDRTMREVWIEVLGFEGFYEVSNFGRIRNSETGGILNPAQTGDYLHVTLCRPGVKANRRVHVIVLSSFCGPKPFEGAHAAHNDGISTNCALSNLRWATPIENQADVKRHGHRCEGEAIFGSKLKVEQVTEIKRLISVGLRNPEIAERFGVSISTIHLIRHGRIWKSVPATKAKQGMAA